MTTTLKQCKCNKSFNANDTASTEMCDSCNDKVKRANYKKELLNRAKKKGGK